jgi:probable F420-dependent oxidoreductase
MRIGVILPQNEITADPVALRDFAQAAEDLGYAHLSAFEHVVGADTTHRPDWRGPYDLHSLFHEPMVMFGYLAGVTKRLELVTNILVLPQRQTAVLAKQAAEVDVLSGGRFRLGVGVGWNQVEYQALGEDFSNRGRRCDEQITVLRTLFTQQSVTYRGRWHDIDGAGLNPLPIQRPIPIWIGGDVEATLRRVGALGDGWFPQMPPDLQASTALARLWDYARAAGREPADIGIEPRLSIAGSTPEQWADYVGRWQALGATHLSVLTMGAGLVSPQMHIDAMRRFRDAVPLQS